MFTWARVRNVGATGEGTWHVLFDQDRVDAVPQFPFYYLLCEPQDNGVLDKSVEVSLHSELGRFKRQLASEPHTFPNEGRRCHTCERAMFPMALHVADLRGLLEGVESELRDGRIIAAYEDLKKAIDVVVAADEALLTEVPDHEPDTP